MKHYLIVTLGYWAFTLTDGAIRMLVILYFHQLGYSPLEVAMLFLFYEFFGVITNLVGGWMGSRLGLNVTMHLGMVMQVVALLLLTVPHAWLSVIYVMFAQALSGIAKDLNKMSAKASVKTLISKNQQTETTLFKWVAMLTGSKNTLKGVGFFLGAFLLETMGFRGALMILAGGLFFILLITLFLLPHELGKAKSSPKFRHIFSNIAAINILSAARFFLFGSRDVWFVVALPVFCYEILHWDFMAIGRFMALWVIGYGIIQALTPLILKGHQPQGRTAFLFALLLALIPMSIAIAMTIEWDISYILVIGLMIFGFIFAINSAVHSYLILAYSNQDKVAMNVGFYYMANAGGRLIGTILSGFIYQNSGLIGCLWTSSLFILIASILSLFLIRCKSQ